MKLNPLQYFLAEWYGLPNSDYGTTEKYLEEFSGSAPARYSHRLIGGIHMPNDLLNLYEINSSGYRSREFNETRDAIVAGCSNTFGMGIPEETIWGSVLCESLELSYDNLGVAGVSIPKIVINTMAHVRQYGKPKYIFCLFPNFARISVPLLDGMHKADDQDFSSDKQSISVQGRIAASIVAPYADIPKIIKKPFYVEQTVNIELATMLAIQYIQMLTMFCKEAGIALLWSTWSDPEDDIFKWLTGENLLDGYVSIDNQDWLYDYENRTESYLGKPCHTDLRSSYSANFDIGTDGEHLGVHRHAHIAQAFLEAARNL